MPTVLNLPTNYHNAFLFYNNNNFLLIILFDFRPACLYVGHVYLEKIARCIGMLTHISLASFLWDISKQQIPRSELGVWSGSPPFAYMFEYKKKNITQQP